MTRLILYTTNETSLSGKSVVILTLGENKYYYDVLSSHNLYSMSTHKLVGKYTRQINYVEEVFECIPCKKVVYDCPFTVFYIIPNQEDELKADVLALIDMFRENFIIFQEEFDEMVASRPQVVAIVEPSVEPIIEPSVEPSVEPIVEQVVEPIQEPVVEPIQEEPIQEPVVEPVVEPVQEDTTPHLPHIDIGGEANIVLEVSELPVESI